jgi:hypothetical protein
VCCADLAEAGRALLGKKSGHENRACYLNATLVANPPAAGLYRNTYYKLQVRMLFCENR